MARGEKALSLPKRTRRSRFLEKIVVGVGENGDAEGGRKKSCPSPATQGRKKIIDRDERRGSRLKLVAKNVFAGRERQRPSRKNVLRKK